jgi:hypothetical protein
LFPVNNWNKFLNFTLTIIDLFFKFKFCFSLKAIYESLNLKTFSNEEQEYQQKHKQLGLESKWAQVIK